VSCRHVMTCWRHFQLSGESKTFFGGPSHFLYMMGLGQGNRAAPPSWIQLSTVLVNVFKQLDLGSLIKDPITAETIHTMGACFVDDIDLYTWREDILDPGGVWSQAQVELEHWSCLLNAMGGALKPEKCFWYLLDYKCVAIQMDQRAQFHRSTSQIPRRPLASMILCQGGTWHIWLTSRRRWGCG
jgi:hypothetical protein